MEIKHRGKTIEIDKELSVLDELALAVFPIIKRYSRYVIVSSYVSIIFGRSRVSDDIDAIIDPLDRNKFSKLSLELEKKGFWFVNSSDSNVIFKMLNEKTSVRIAKKGNALPNIEIKYAHDSLDKSSLGKAINVRLNATELKISAIEQQIAYKFYLGTERDIEDAIYLFKIFEGNLDKKMLMLYGKELKVARKMIKFGVIDG